MSAAARHRQALAGFARRFLWSRGLMPLLIAAALVLLAASTRGRELEPGAALAELNGAFWVAFIAAVLGLASSADRDLRGPEALTLFSGAVGRWPWLLGLFLGGAATLAAGLALAGGGCLLAAALRPTEGLELYQGIAAARVVEDPGNPVDGERALSPGRVLVWRFAATPGDALLIRGRTLPGVGVELGRPASVAVSLQRGAASAEHHVELADGALVRLPLPPGDGPLRAALRLERPEVLVCFPIRRTAAEPITDLRLDGAPRSLASQVFLAQVWLGLRLLPALALTLALGSVFPPRAAAVAALVLAAALELAPPFETLAYRLAQIGPRAAAIRDHPLKEEWSGGGASELRSQLVGGALRALSRALPQRPALRRGRWLTHREALNLSELGEDGARSAIACLALLSATALALRRREFP